VPIAMEEGLRFAIREGGRTVGAGVVAHHRVTTLKTAGAPAVRLPLFLFLRGQARLS
jgi:hypothetical protein